MFQQVSAGIPAPGGAGAGRRGFSPVPESLLYRLRGHFSEEVWLILLAVLAGGVIGCAAWALKWMIAAVSRFSINGIAGRFGWWTMLLLPLVGVILASVFQRYVLRREIYHGVDRLQADFAAGRCRLPVVLTFSPLLACAASLGFGGSAGSEGPIAYAGAAIGNNVGRLFGISDKGLSTMMAVGAGAGIAAIFKSPVGGALFTLECLGIGSGPLTALALFSGCVCAGLTSFALSGFTPNIVFASYTPFDWHLTLPLLALAVFCGVYSAYYSAVMARMTRWFEGMRSPWTRNVVSGAVIGLLVFTFPALFGEGYGVIGEILSGRPEAAVFRSPLLGLSLEPGTLLLAVCFGVMAVKAFATSSTNSGGGVAGDFAPTLFAGAVCGYFFARIAGALFGIDLPAADFACYGMAAVMAGAVRAPLMAMFIVAESTMRADVLLPAAIAAVVSYAVTRLIQRAF